MIVSEKQLIEKTIGILENALKNDIEAIHIQKKENGQTVVNYSYIELIGFNDVREIVLKIDDGRFLGSYSNLFEIRVYNDEGLNLYYLHRRMVETCCAALRIKALESLNELEKAGI